jgi:signal transduction histidine kinase
VRWYEAQGVAEPGRDGTASAVLVVARDATLRVAAERQLARALTLAESANATKSRFLATMSHELRTPLNAIRGFTELLEIGVHGPVNDGQRECLSRIRRSEEHLLALISDILDHARIEAGRMRYDTTPVPVAALVDDVLAWMGRHADAARVTLRGDACTAWARGDPRRVRQVLVNLVSNALKFTPAGGTVEVRCRAPSAPGGAMVTVDVLDTGPGVPAEARERVFEPFEQLGRSRRSPVAGLGLGLAISRELARGMGGDLTAHEAPGGGACFRLTLPASAAPISRGDPVPTGR